MTKKVWLGFVVAPLVSPLFGLALTLALTMAGLIAGKPISISDTAEVMAEGTFYLTFAGIVALVGAVPAFFFMRQTGRLTVYHFVALWGFLEALVPIGFFGLMFLYYPTAGALSPLLSISPVCASSGMASGAAFWLVALRQKL